MRRLYREEYADFTVKHFHEDLRKRQHSYLLGYTVTRLALQSGESGDARPGGGPAPPEAGPAQAAPWERCCIRMAEPYFLDAYDKEDDQYVATER